MRYHKLFYQPFLWCAITNFFISPSCDALWQTFLSALLVMRYYKLFYQPFLWCTIVNFLLALLVVHYHNLFISPACGALSETFYQPFLWCSMPNFLLALLVVHHNFFSSLSCGALSQTSLSVLSVVHYHRFFNQTFILCIITLFFSTSCGVLSQTFYQPCLWCTITDFSISPACGARSQTFLLAVHHPFFSRKNNMVNNTSPAHKNFNTQFLAYVVSQVMENKTAAG